ncbi:addiction module protein [Demequina sp.]|uniref:addiction module protein n=1 Tax=Demequina sp. TaxID=2050685 RepID=UPI003D0FC390
MTHESEDAELHAPAPDAEISDAWLAEIERRVEDVVQGRVELADAEQTYRELSAELRTSAQ